MTIPPNTHLFTRNRIPHQAQIYQLLKPHQRIQIRQLGNPILRKHKRLQIRYASRQIRLNIRDTVLRQEERT